ncbi:MAG: 4-(cytidine 5'-diphospho)-2-C-methyl-D-erythritol kinase [Clostridia bacterium]|nr:4-(cytidine 5'-diphospho)-2-C-methyl-D-erythritol kinase [Clostridia bacterium]
MADIFKSYGKINLSLDIVGIRDDGYHLISSVMAETELCDIITVSLEKSDKFENEIVLTCNVPYIPCNEKNSAYKAAQIMLGLSGKHNVKVVIDVDKRLPVAGGLGGSSTNGATVIKALNSMLECNFDADKLREISVKIGADVPFFIEGGIALAEGIGEKITKIDTDYNTFLLIAKYGKGANSKNIYAQFDATEEKNPFTTEKIQPSIINLKKTMKNNGALGAEMSGSGSSVYGIFDNIRTCEKAYGAVKALYPDADVFITRIKNE